MNQFNLPPPSIDYVGSRLDFLALLANSEFKTVGCANGQTEILQLWLANHLEMVTQQKHPSSSRLDKLVGMCGLVKMSEILKLHDFFKIFCRWR